MVSSSVCPNSKSEINILLDSSSGFRNCDSQNYFLQISNFYCSKIEEFNLNVDVIQITSVEEPGICPSWGIGRRAEVGPRGATTDQNF